MVGVASSIQTLSLFWGLSMAGPVPAPAPAPGPILSNVTAHDLEIHNVQRDDYPPIKLQYYTDYACTKYNVDFTIPANTGCYNYNYAGTHSVNAVSWPRKDEGKVTLVCKYYAVKDCQGAGHEVGNDECVSDLKRFESLYCIFYH
ncbi:uncharacterized protein B0I36DRAFT_431676 [Microdochium trichocladiopsis]|uniref:Uncharacterized protein n=1 Tax=Microdochium trichocladiopsis TaxID=1682393 RepID=A0A9P8YA79_9PEZI|nr:uncharacterized protein B0I36DRAFT_431676 [Microdochium trichocladiopsis]KAH7031619.1 hypothetical protein B0I36DRAFT_431676 [Microdochium trichocladiopsis]